MRRSRPSIISSASRVTRISRTQPHRRASPLRPRRRSSCPHSGTSSAASTRSRTPRSSPRRCRLWRPLDFGASRPRGRPTDTVALEEYTKGNVDAVLLCYAKWISTLRQEPTVRVLIPAEIPAREREATGARADYIYEPDPESVLDGLLPRYVETQVFQAVLENKASEYSAKMIAMQNATKAAGDLI